MRRAVLALVLAIAQPVRAADTPAQAANAPARAAAPPARAADTPAQSAPPPARPAAPPARAVDTAIPWDQTEQHVGETVVVEGRVLGVHCSQLSCLLAFDPTFNRFTAVVQAENFDRFPPSQLDALYSGRKVQVHGTIVTRDKKPEIILSAP